MQLSQVINQLQFTSRFSALKTDTVIIVRIKGETGEAHAAAILAYFGFTTANEAAFQQKYGYSLREHFTEFYSKNDSRRSHKHLGKNVFEVRIPIPADLYTKIKEIKKAENDSVNPTDGAGVNDLLQPLAIPDNASSSEKLFYQEINTLRSTLTNFGSRAVQASDVRAEYLKLIKMSSDEFIELVRSGKITPEEGARRASTLRNFVLDISRGKDSELGRAIAESLKKEGLSFDKLLQRYAQKKFNLNFSTLSKVQQDSVYLEVVLASGRDRSSVSKLAPILGKAGRVFLVASIAISVYNVATAEDKVNAAGKEGASILGGIAGGAAGGAAAGLICGPGAPICSGIGIFVGGAIGAFVASGGYDWITGK
jgi:hypothetical protein